MTCLITSLQRKRSQNYLDKKGAKMDKQLVILVFGVFILFCAKFSFAVEKNLSDVSNQVTIYRDTYWVPHIFGKTDEACAFGIGYAQAEDNLPQIIQSIRQATGTLAEVNGKDFLDNDYYSQLTRISQYAYENYHKIPLEMRVISEAYCKGVNYYVKKHPDKTPQSWRELVPQDVVAFGRYVDLFVFTGYPGSAFYLIDRYESPSKTGEAIPAHNPDGIGSNMWAISPERSTINKSMLVINPHLPWDGLLQWWEFHVKSEEGWNAMGATFFGAPIVCVGHNENLGWSHTVNAPDIWNLYRIELNPQNPNQYLYDGKWLDISVTNININVKTEDHVESVSRSLEYTHYGPILRREGDHAYSVKLSGWDDVLASYQWYKMSKAKNFTEFKEAMQIMAIPMFNVVYADRDGNVFYAYNGKVGRKSEKFNWRDIVKGGTPETEWTEYMKFDELPQVFNPKSGFVQNCNSTPFETTAGNDNPRKENFPDYLTTEGMGTRAQRLRQVFESKDKFSVEDFIEMPWDTWSLVASNTIPYLLEIAKKISTAELQNHTSEAIDILSNWDLKMTKESKAVPIFYRWLTLYWEKAKTIYAEPDPMGLSVYRGIGEPDTAMGCLKQAVSDIYTKYNKFPTWGEIHHIRHGKVDMPIDGAEGERFGTLSTIGGYYNNETGQFQLGGGHSYVSVVVFSDPIKAWSIFPYGHNRIDPESRHYADQTELFAKFQFKPAWFTEEEIMGNLEMKYSLPYEEQK
jgi:acyl-homoserine-lactone acylase